MQILLEYVTSVVGSQKLLLNFYRSDRERAPLEPYCGGCVGGGGGCGTGLRYGAEQRTDPHELASLSRAGDSSSRLRRNSKLNEERLLLNKLGRSVILS